jgi:hypothetical protein
MAYCIVSGKLLSNVMARLLVANIVIGLVGSLVAIPLYQRYVLGNYAELARMILVHVGEQPIYANDVTAVGLSQPQHDAAFKAAHHIAATEFLIRLCPCA